MLNIYRFLIRESHGLCGIGALANIADPAKMPHLILVLTDYQSTYQESLVWKGIVGKKSSHTTPVNCRPTHGNVRKGHRTLTVTRHQEVK